MKKKSKLRKVKYWMTLDDAKDYIDEFIACAGWSEHMFSKKRDLEAILSDWGNNSVPVQLKITFEVVK